MKTIKLEIKTPSDLKHDLPCPNCNRIISADNQYICKGCKIQVVFFLKQKLNHGESRNINNI